MFDDESSSILSDDIQDAGSDLAGIGTDDSNFVDKVCDDFSASEDSSCFALPVSNWFSTLVVQEIP